MSPKTSPSLGTAFRRNLIIGLIALAPLALTVWIVSYLFSLLVTNRFTRTVADLLLKLWPFEADSRIRLVLARVLAFLLLAAAVFLLGFFVRSLLGRRLYRLAERVVERIPGVNRIYLFIRQIAEAVFAQRKTLFREVVMIEYPRAGLHSLAFVTAHVPPEFAEPMGVPGNGRLLALFVPTTPNPTSGFLLFVRESEVRRFPAGTSEAMSLILSGGTIYPGAPSDLPRPRLIDLLQDTAADADAPPPPHPAP